MSNVQSQNEQIAKKENDSDMKGQLEEEQSEIELQLKKKQDLLLQNKQKLKEIKKIAKEAQKLVETEEDVVVAVKHIQPTPMPVVPIANSFDEPIPEDEHEHHHEEE